jgi:ornithine cyclodeaminase
VFVRFPGRQKERIIALPAYLGGEREVAGIKWISSFPGNLERGISRASAIMVLNSLVTGRPEAIMEGSLISAARTAASAALAADVLHAPGDIDVLGVIGCGLINREIVRYICSLNRGIGAILAFDIDRERADAFGRAVGTLDRKIDYEVCASTEDLISRASVISFATTAVEPSVPRISVGRKGTTVLHISLRDLTPAAILEADNVVDDVDHVMRAQTSVHLAEQQVGHRRFVRCTLAEVLAGAQPPRRDATSTVVFSPFGLGVLDLAVASLVMRRGASSGTGTKLQEFFAGT